MKHKITLHAKVLHKADGTGQKRAFDRLHNIARTDLAIYFSHVVAYICVTRILYTLQLKKTSCWVQCLTRKTLILAESIRAEKLELVTDVDRLVGVTIPSSNDPGGLKKARIPQRGPWAESLFVRVRRAALQKQNRLS